MIFHLKMYKLLLLATAEQIYIRVCVCVCVCFFFFLIKGIFDCSLNTTATI